MIGQIVKIRGRRPRRLIILFSEYISPWSGEASMVINIRIMMSQPLFAAQAHEMAYAAPLTVTEVTPCHGGHRQRLLRACVRVPQSTGLPYWFLPRILKVLHFSHRFFSHSTSFPFHAAYKLPIARQQFTQANQGRDG